MPGDLTTQITLPLKITFTKMKVPLSTRENRLTTNKVTKDTIN